jgi:NADH-quinone oxidoreductase subunit E
MRIHAIVQSHPAEARHALAILQHIQRELSYIPREALAIVHGHIGTSEAKLYAIATFYKALSLEAKGRHIIKVCDGTACHMRGNFTLIKGIEAMLGIMPGETTADGLFSLELVNCLGSCALAPVMVVDDAYHSRVSADKLSAILESYTADA